MKNLLFSIIGLLALNVIGQNGIVKGKVINTDSSAVAFATVLIDSGKYVTTADYEGFFRVSVPVGKYCLSLIPLDLDLSRLEICDLEVKEDLTNDLGLLVVSKGIKMGDIIINYGNVQPKSKVKCVLKEFNSPNVKEVISPEDFETRDASDVPDAVGTAPGVTVEGGKFVYVRGLGDRYNKTTLNGLEIPGLDPDKNAVQMDVFPTNIVGGLEINKNFTADMPADFAGGIVNLDLKMPSKKKSGISLGVGYVPEMHFNTNYLASNRVAGDVVAMGAKGRSMPAFSLSKSNTELMSAFNPNLAPTQNQSFLDYSLSAFYGSKKVLSKGEVLYSASLSYSEKTRFYQDVQQNRYALSSDNSINGLIRRSVQLGDYGTNEVLLTGLAAGQYILPNTTLNSSIIRIQNGKSTAGVFSYEAPTNDPFEAIQYNLEYNQRNLTNYFIGATHNFKEGSKWELQWKLSPTFSSMNDPDVRVTRYNLSNSTPYGTEAGLPTRIWRDMKESNYAGKVDFTRKFLSKDSVISGKLRFGIATTLKERAFSVEYYQIQVQNLSQVNMGDDPNDIFNSENIYGSNSAPQGAGFLAGQPTSFSSSDPNAFNSKSDYYASYISSEILYRKKLELIFGLRLEQFNMAYSGYNLNEFKYLIKQKMLNNTDLFPSIAASYKIREKQKIRFSATKTIARPSFKEMSFASIIDPISGITFLGGKNQIDNWDGNLVETDIYNIDLRWEALLKNAQALSISSFYKHFINPIEVIQITNADGNFQPRNVGNTEVFGAELESSWNLGLLNKKLKPIALNFNYTKTYSRVKMSDLVRESKIQNKREGEEVNQYRVMAGQAPFIVNTGLEYKAPLDSGKFSNLRFGLYYSVKGQTLQYVGITERPDVYSVPFHSLHLTMNKEFGMYNQYKFKMKFSNILNDSNDLIYSSYGAKETFFSGVQVARSLSVGFSMKF